MDNAQGLPTSAPSQGQAETQVQAPMPSESSNGAVDTTPSQTPAEGQPEAGEGFKMPDKFVGKSAEDIAKIYVDLESHNKKVEMERADLEKLFIGEQSTQTANVEPQKVQSDSTTSEQPTGEEAVETKMDTARIAREAVQRAISPVVARFEIKDMLDRYGDRFKAVANEVKAIRAANPTLSMEMAFKQADYDNLQRTSYNRGVSEASQTAENKVKAQVESSRSSGYKPTSIEDAIKNPNVSVAEIADALGPEYDSFKEISRRRSGK